MRNKKLSQLKTERKALQISIQLLSKKIAGELKCIKKNGNGKTARLPHPVIRFQPA